MRDGRLRSRDGESRDVNVRRVGGDVWDEVDRRIALAGRGLVRREPGVIERWLLGDDAQQGLQGWNLFTAAEQPIDGPIRWDDVNAATADRAAYSPNLPARWLPVPLASNVDFYLELDWGTDPGELSLLVRNDDEVTVWGPWTCVGRRSGLFPFSLMVRAGEEVAVSLTGTGDVEGRLWVNFLALGTSGQQMPTPTTLPVTFVVGGRVGGDGVIWTSDDGVTWELANLADVGNGLSGGFASDGELLVGVGESGHLYTSDDARTWDRTSVDATSLRDVAYGDGLFITAGFSGIFSPNPRLFTSPDGLTWTQQSVPVSGSLHGAAVGAGLYVASGADGAVITSPDGVTWTQQSTPTSVTVLDVAWHDGLFVACGRGSSLVMTSPDGVTWTLQTTPTSVHLYRVTFGAGLWVAVGDGGVILTSPDAEVWTQQSTPTTEQLRNVTYEGGLYVATGENGTLLTSPDAVTWTAQSVLDSEGEPTTATINAAGHTDL